MGVPSVPFPGSREQIGNKLSGSWESKTLDPESVWLRFSFLKLLLSRPNFSPLPELKLNMHLTHCLKNLSKLSREKERDFPQSVPKSLNRHSYWNCGIPPINTVSWYAPFAQCSVGNTDVCLDISEFRKPPLRWPKTHLVQLFSRMAHSHDSGKPISWIRTYPCLTFIPLLLVFRGTLILEIACSQCEQVTSDRFVLHRFVLSTFKAMQGHDHHHIMWQWVWKKDLH